MQLLLMLRWLLREKSFGRWIGGSQTGMRGTKQLKCTPSCAWNQSFLWLNHMLVGSLYLKTSIADVHFGDLSPFGHVESVL